MPFFKYKTRLRKDLLSKNYYVRDTSATSPDYFDVTHFPSTIGGGKSVFKIRGNGANLELNSKIDVEVLDVNGEPIYYEIASFIDRFNQYYISVSVFDDTVPGVGRFILVGKASSGLNGEPIPDEWDNQNSVIWTRDITILPYERNNSELVFSDPPKLSVAQVITPQRILLAGYDQPFSTASLANSFRINTSDFKNFDKNTSQDNGITDLDIQKISINASKVADTVNSVDTTTRTPVEDGTGYYVNKVNRYNTVLRTTSSFFIPSHIGGIFEITGSTPTILLPTPGVTANNKTVSISGSLNQQVNRYTPIIVDVINDTTALLSEPLKVKVSVSNNPTSNTFLQPRILQRNIDWTYKTVSGSFLGRLLFRDASAAFITSSNISQSYVEFTFQDLDPIGGQIYKIRPFYKLSGRSGDYKLLNDQIVRPVEYLTDAKYPNQTSYGKHISDYYLVGHFTDPTLSNEYWITYIDEPSGFSSNTASIDSSVQLASVKLIASQSANHILTTNFDQNYETDQSYTLTTNITLDPNTELEIYMLSDILSVNITNTGYPSYPRAFLKTPNLEKTRYSDTLSRYGKLVGRITNNTNLQKQYGKLAFDFESDSSGLGKPLFRAKSLSTLTTGSCYISQVSITPTALNGFTPNIVQFAIPIEDEFAQSLSQSIDFKLEYFDYTGNQSEYTTFLHDVPLNIRSEIASNACQAESLSWNFNPRSWHKTPTASVSFLDWYHDILATPTASLDNAFFSASGHFYWPAIEYLQGTFNIAGNTYNTPLPFWAVTFGSYNTTTDTPLWNIRRPSLLGDGDLNGSYTGQGITHTNNYPVTSPGVFSNVRGRITSSWNYVSTFTERFGSYTGTSLANLVAHITGSTPSMIFQNPTNATTTSSIDAQAFFKEGCVGITRALVSESYYSQSFGSTAQKTEGIKKRRLMYPMNGSHTSSFFNTNGGIYNVRFKLKRSGSYSPDTGSYMDIYIFNSNATFTSETPGVAGWKPPSNNIVTIGHGYVYGGGAYTTPLISNFDPATNAWYDEYDITLIQYGSPGQLVFEPGGVTGSNSYFGTLIDDISFCKIGVTTDPNYVKPTATFESYINSLVTYYTDPGDLIDPGAPV